MHRIGSSANRRSICSGRPNLFRAGINSQRSPLRVGQIICTGQTPPPYWRRMVAVHPIMISTLDSKPRPNHQGLLALNRLQPPSSFFGQVLSFLEYG